MKSWGMGGLSCALLGLLSQNPASGYDLRKEFSPTLLGNFSDSPGAIYPALARLEKAGLIRGKVQRAGPRQRKLFRITPAGASELRAWLARPVAAFAVARKMDELMLRFVLLESVAGPAATLNFLLSLKKAVASFLGTLRERDSPRFERSTSETLALQNAIACWIAHSRWTDDAILVYKNKVASQ